MLGYSNVYALTLGTKSMEKGKGTEKLFPDLARESRLAIIRELKKKKISKF